MTSLPEPKIFFTSDQHHDHSNIIRYDNEALAEKLGYAPRPYKTVEEMDEHMILLWNETVGFNDDVYQLGDFFMGKDWQHAEHTLLRLNGNIHHIRGNHRKFAGSPRL